MGFMPDLSDLGAEDVPNGHLFLHLGVKDGVLARDEWGTDILDELAPIDDDTVLYKTRFSGFYRTELDELLKGSGIKHLIVTGCTTSICVESTVRDAFFRDYHCVVLEDCTAEPMAPASAAATTTRRSCSWSASSDRSRHQPASSTHSAPPKQRPP